MKRLDQTTLSMSDAGVASPPHLGMRLALCVVVTLACAALFCGSTFAWFTDGAMCSVEEIQASETWESANAAADEQSGSPADAPSSQAVQSGAAQGQSPVDEGSAEQGNAVSSELGQEEVSPDAEDSALELGGEDAGGAVGNSAADPDAARTEV